MLESKNTQITVAYNFSEKDLKSRVYHMVRELGVKLIPYDTQIKISDIPILKIKNDQLYLEHGDQTLFFHPSMSLLRMLNIIRGIEDRFLQTVKIAEGDTVLDATMGLASDALISAHAVGETGKVIAIEYSPLIHLLVTDGLNRLKERNFRKIAKKEKEQAWVELAKASSRINAICANHNTIIEGLPDNSIDIIYFDPMFRNTIGKSSSIKPIKSWSFSEPLSFDIITQACRVAKKRVVLKERKNGGEFERLGFKILNESRYSPVSFGVIELSKKKGGTLCNPL